VLNFGSIKNLSMASSLGAPATAANGTIAVGASTTTGVLNYTGAAGDTTDRVINLKGTTGGATITQSGAAGNLLFTSDFTATGAGIKTLTLNGSTAGTGEISGAIVNNSATNPTSVTKDGTGKWILSGTNTYTGATSVTSGTLAVNGSLTGSPVSVASGATLGGTGSIITSSTTILAGGKLAPGNSIGTMNLAATTVNGSFDVEYDATSMDRLNTSGVLTLGAGSTLNLIGSGASLSSFIMVTYTSLSGTFGTVTGIPAGYSLDYAFNNGISSNNIALTAVPEASTTALSLMGIMSLVHRRRARIQR
jgi:autotransporter-associated beta strand protein